MTTASNLRTLVTVQQRAAGTDAVGQPLTGWIDLASVRADVRHLSGIQAVKGDGIVSAVRASARVRRRADITSAMRLVIAGMPYDIRAVVPVDDGRQWLDLVCEAVS